MYNLVNFRYRRVPGLGKAGITSYPSGLEFVVSCPSALSAWSMARGERCRLIEEKQLAIGACTEYRALSTLEFQQAGDPTLSRRGYDDCLAHVVQDPAIAEQRAACLNGMQATPRINAILQRHEMTSAAHRSVRAAHVHGRAGDPTRTSLCASNCELSVEIRIDHMLSARLGTHNDTVTDKALALVRASSN